MTRDGSLTICEGDKYVLANERSPLMANENELQELVAAARKNGWASATGKLEVLRFQARWSELIPMSSRHGQSPVGGLSPVGQGNAPRRFPSARYGGGDVAISHGWSPPIVPPRDIAILAAEEPSPPGGDGLSPVLAGKLWHLWRSPFWAGMHVQRRSPVLAYVLRVDLAACVPEE